MSFIDKAKEAFEDAKEALSDSLVKAKDAIGDNIGKVTNVSSDGIDVLSGISLSNVDKVESAINTAGGFIDEQTGGKFDSKHARGMFAMDFPWAEIYPYLVHNKTVVRGILGPVVATQGSGPYAEEAFDQFLANCGIKVRFLLGDEPPDVVVLGTHDWSEDDVHDLLVNCSGDIRVYSQEMVVASMAVGADIFDFDVEGETIRDFIVGHPALEYFHQVEFMVPGLAEDDEDEERIQIYQEPVETLPIDVDGSLLPAQGILREMGYRAGKSGLLPHQRREILRRTFEVQLVSTSAEATDYIAEWGDRCSQARFLKMDRVLGGLAANAEKKTKLDMSEAIADWKQDQAWLRKNYKQWLHHSH